MATTDRDRFARINLSPRSGKILGSYALFAMHGWFLTKLTLPSADGVAELLVGIAAITGMLASVFFFAGTLQMLLKIRPGLLRLQHLLTWRRAQMHGPVHVGQSHGDGGQPHAGFGPQAVQSLI